jgi:hypothetical protein
VILNIVAQIIIAVQGAAIFAVPTFTFRAQISKQVLIYFFRKPASQIATPSAILTMVASPRLVTMSFQTDQVM